MLDSTSVCLLVNGFKLSKDVFILLKSNLVIQGTYACETVLMKDSVVVFAYTSVSTLR
jgi:hypothetical protein